MRARLFILVGIAAAAAFLFQFGVRPVTSVPVTSVPAATEELAPASRVEDLELLPPEEALEGAREVAGETVLSEPAEPPESSEAERYGIYLKLIEAHTSTPLRGVRLVTSAAGKRPPSSVAADAQSTATDHDGIVLLEGFHRRGPWDVYVLPYVPLAGVSGRPRGCLAGTLTAAPISGEIGSAHGLSLRVLRVAMGGTTALLTSPLPTGVNPSDVIFELNGRASALSSEFGGLTQFAQGAAAENGWVRGRFRPLRNSVRSPGMTIHVVTADGRYGLSVSKDGNAYRDTVVEIDEPLEPRGVVQVELVTIGAREPFPTGQAFIDAVNRVRFKRVDSTNGPPSRVQASSLLGRRVPRSPQSFEIHALPLEPFEIGDVFGFSFGQRPFDYGGFAPSYGSVTWRPAEVQRVTPSHGAPSLVTIALRAEEAK